MYNKIFTKILDSSIWLEPDQTRIVWLTLLAAMDEDGFAQFASVPNLAHRAIVPVEAAQRAVEALEGPDANSSDPDHEGRRIERVPGGWIVLNAAKYRSLVTKLVHQERVRERVRKHRNAKRVTPVTTNDPVTPSEAEAYTEERVRTRPQSIMKRRRLDAAFEHECGIYLPQRAHDDFAALHPGEDLFAWFMAVCSAWAGRNTGADMFRFWKARHDERWPPEQPAVQRGKPKPVWYNPTGEQKS